MDVIHLRNEYREACTAVRAGGRSLGFVPTMGALHEGHRSLLRRAREECDAVAMSIFINPLQFGPREDLGAYPRDLHRDLALAGEEGVDVVYAPSEEEMYPGGEPRVTVDPGALGDRLEGATRPGHFRGVCTVVAKLLATTGPCTAFFGEKDAQQLAVIRRMVADLDMPVVVVGCPTVRGPDGLAMSSRNAYLSPEERTAALCLHRALSRARDLAREGQRDASVLRKEMAEVIESEERARLDYATIVDESSFEEVDMVEPARRWRVFGRDTAPQAQARALVAAWVGTTRLIDNMPLP